MSDPLVSINIPCYHQLEHARRRCDVDARADASAISRSRCSTTARRTSIATTWQSLGDRRVRYHRNPERLGAMREHVPGDHAGRGTLHARVSRGRPARSALSRRPPSDPRAAIPAAASSAASCGNSRPSRRRTRWQTRPPARPSCCSRRRAEFVRGDFSRGRADVRVGRLSPRGASPASAPPTTSSPRWSIGRSCWRFSGRMVGRRDPRAAGLVPEARRRRHAPPRDDDRPHPAAVLGLPRAAAGAGSAATIGRCSTATLDTGCSRCIDLMPPERGRRCGRSSFAAWREGLYDPRWSRGYGRKRLIGLMLTGR